MEVLTYSTENCFICRELLGSFRNELSVMTGYSEKTLYQLIEEFTNIGLSDEIIQEAAICQNCFIKFNEFDQYRMLAEQIQIEIVALFEESCNEPVQEPIKQEYEDLDHGLDSSIEAYETYEEEAPVEFGKLELDQVEERTDSIQTITYEWVKKAEESLPTFQKPRVSRSRQNRTAEISFIEEGADNQKMYQCELCLRVFKEKSKLKYHRQIHTSERNVVCPTCGKCFKTQACLRSHKRVHNPMYYFCDLCGKCYTQKPEIAKHIKFVHLQIREFFCQVCGSGFGSKGHLSTHMLTHSDQSAKNAKCEVCSLAFYTKAKLERHMKTHTKERNYECGLCGKKFLYSYNVTAHVKHVHYGEKRKENEKFCSLCGKKFQKLWALQDHMAQEHKVVEA